VGALTVVSVLAVPDPATWLVLLGVAVIVGSDVRFSSVSPVPWVAAPVVVAAAIVLGPSKG
jgi:hypothetical protein